MEIPNLEEMHCLRSPSSQVRRVSLQGLIIETASLFLQFEGARSIPFPVPQLRQALLIHGDIEKVFEVLRIRSGQAFSDPECPMLEVQRFLQMPPDRSYVSHSIQNLRQHSLGLAFLGKRFQYGSRLSVADQRGFRPPEVGQVRIPLNIADLLIGGGEFELELFITGSVLCETVQIAQRTLDHQLPNRG